MPIRVSGPLPGATRPFGMPTAASGRFGMCKPMPPSPPGRSRTSDPYGKVVEPGGAGDHVRDARTETDIARGCSRGPARGPGCRDDDPAHRPAWSRTGATVPAPAAASADTGSLCVPIGSQSRREHKGCLQGSWPRVRRQSRPSRCVGRRGRDHDSRDSRRRCHRDGESPGASRRGRPGLLGWEGARPRRRDGRSPSRRPGGPAPMRRQRRPRRPPVTTQGFTRETDGLDRRVIGDRRENTRPDWPPGGRSDSAEVAELPNRERCRSGGFPGDRRGVAPPSPAPPCITGGRLACLP